MPRLLLPATLLAAALCPVWAHDPLEVQLHGIDTRILVDPGNAALYFERAELERGLHRYGAAHIDYQAAAQIKPSLHAALLGEAFAYLDQGSAASACRMFDRFLRRLPENAEGLLGKARCLDKLNRAGESAETYTRLLQVETEPRPEHYLARSAAEVRAGRPAEALEGLDEGIAKLGRIVSLELPAIELALGLGRTDDALARIDYFAETSPRPESWLARRAAIYEQCGNPAAAREDRLAAMAAIRKVAAARPVDRATQELLKSLEEKTQR